MRENTAIIVFEPEILALEIMIEQLYQEYQGFLARLDKIEKILKEARA